MNEERMQHFTGQVLSDLSAAYGGVMVNLGYRLGLYRAMAGAGPVRSEELAERTGTHHRYVREWLFSQMAGGYVTYDPATDTFHLPEEHAMLLADDQSPVFMAPAFAAAGSMYIDEDKTVEIFRSGEGMPWGEHHHRLFHAVEAFYRNGYKQHLTTSWIPALEGVEARLRAGGCVVDVGCGHGASTILMAKAYPKSEFVGFDAHAGSIATAIRRASDAGLSDRIRFEVADAGALESGRYDLICFMDSYHDMGDPHLVARRARKALRGGGSLLLVEPFASDRKEENVGPVARLYYAASTTMCTPNAMSQGKLALGAQAGHERTAATLKEAGFGKVRVVEETPFNLILEAKV